MTTYTNIITDRIKVADSNAATNLNKFLAVSSSMILGQVVIPQARFRVSITEHPKFGASYATNGIFHVALTTTLRAVSTVAAATLLKIASSLRFADATRVSYVLSMVDALVLHDGVSTTAAFSQPVAAVVSLLASVQGGWARSAFDRLVLLPAAVSRLKARIVAAETAIFKDAETVKLVINQIVPDFFDVTDTPTVKAMLFDSLAETVELSIRLTAPDGSTTAWAINSRTGAVTEYQNYDFTSYTQMPNGVVLATGRDGNLYELQGQTDDGAAIVADMAGGLLDLGGSAFTQLKAAYLGVRGAGTYYLRLTTQNDVTRLYEVRARPLQTARVDIGKGLRSRYIQWELISTGQDFDLTGIEFLPLISSRRI